MTDLLHVVCTKYTSDKCNTQHIPRDYWIWICEVSLRLLAQGLRHSIRCPLLYWPSYHTSTSWFNYYANTDNCSCYITSHGIRQDDYTPSKIWKEVRGRYRGRFFLTIRLKECNEKEVQPIPDQDSTQYSQMQVSSTMWTFGCDNSG